MTKGWSARSFGLLNVVVLVVLATSMARARAGDDPVDAIDAAAVALTRVQLKSGLFLYQQDFVKGRAAKKQSLVRQAGAAFSLGDYLVRRGYSAKPEVAPALIRALRALGKRSVPYGSGRVISKDGTLGGAKAGATALALLAVTFYGEATGEHGLDDLRADWLGGLLSLHRPGRGFSSRPGLDGESPYFNGEGWLALAHYRRLFPDDRLVAKVLAELDGYLLGRYGDHVDTGFFHWGIMGAEARFRVTKDKKFAAFAASQTDTFISKTRPKFNPRLNSCYMVEGLASAAHLLADAGGDQVLRARILMRTRDEMAKNLDFQIKPGQRVFPLGAGRFLHTGDISRFAGLFRDGLQRLTARVDFTQHCLSAMLKFEDLGLGSSCQSDEEVRAEVVEGFFIGQEDAAKNCVALTGDTAFADLHENIAGGFKERRRGARILSQASFGRVYGAALGRSAWAQSRRDIRRATSAPGQFSGPVCTAYGKLLEARAAQSWEEFEVFLEGSFQEARALVPKCE